MTRTPEQLVAALAAAGRSTPFDADRSWAELLFDGDLLRAPAAPDQALLGAVAAEFAELDAHLALLPERLRIAWLSELLRIPRLPVVPDRVVAQVQVDPARSPVVVARGSLLRGGKDAAGRERRYATHDVLTAHGAAVVGVRSLVPGGAGGLPGLLHREPLPLDPAVAESGEHHVLRLSSNVLAFTGGDLEVTVSFTDGEGVDGLTGALWRWSRADDAVSDLVPGVVAGGVVKVRLAGDCTPHDGLAWLEGVVPADVAVPEGLAFTAAKVAVSQRTGLTPDAVLHNDAALDLSRPFEPFGATPRRGDAFYVRSDEAFAKELASLTLTLWEPEDLFRVVVRMALASSERARGQVLRKVRPDRDWGEIAVIERLSWESRVGRTWGRFHGVDELETVSGVPVPAGSAVTVGGQEGFFVRARIAGQDFGWSRYEANLVAFATAAVRTPATASMPTRPAPPVLAGISIGYTTAPLTARVESRSGWRRLRHQGGRFVPFRRRPAEGPETGMVAIGLALPDAALGSSVSVHVQVAAAAPCGGPTEVSAQWEWWTGSVWERLPIDDGTRFLRGSGLLRFLAPVGWAVGCADLDADGGAGAGRWLRLVTTTPAALGVVLAVTPDAVMADFVSAAADPQTDPSPEVALPPGAIKGLLTPIPGVKKVTNIDSVRGRGPEDAAAYARRAGAQVRHRDRAISGWDYEQIVTTAFPELAAVRCLPHTLSDGTRAPGHVGLVLLPDVLDDRRPRPSLTLAGRVEALLAPMIPVNARLAVLCPDYVEVMVTADVRLQPGVAALIGRAAVEGALADLLHPTRTRPVRWGRSLHAATVIARLERLAEVDVVTSLTMRGPAGVTDIIEVDACRGLFCAASEHQLEVVEQL